MWSLLQFKSRCYTLWENMTEGHCLYSINHVVIKNIFAVYCEDKGFPMHVEKKSKN